MGIAKAVEIRKYEADEAAVFFKTRERFGGLSNMAAGFPIVIEGVEIRTSEALYQACRFPHLPEVQEIILAETSPMTAKMKSKKFKQDSRSDWPDVRVRIMKWCLRVKLVQNFNKFSDELLRTGDAAIVEKKIRREDFWGAKIQPNGNFIGRNVLGRLLMELRYDIYNGVYETGSTIEPPKVSNFCLLGKNIGKVNSAAATERIELLL